MYELRVLNGLHRGATLPLDGKPHLIGANDTSDVMLADAGIAAQHAILWTTKTGWLLSAVDGAIRDAEDNLSQSEIDLTSGEMVRVGDIWLAIVEKDAPWEEPPAEPTHIQSDAIDVDNQPLAPLISDEPATKASPFTIVRQRHEGRNITFSLWKKKFILIPLAGIAAVSVAAAYAMTIKSTTDVQAETVALQSRIGSQSPMQSEANVVLTHGQQDGKTAIAATRKLTPEQLRKAFRKQLADASLLKRLDLALGDQSWTMQGTLDDEESRRFERVLVEFLREYQIAFPVHAKVFDAEAMLPFKVRMVISGANASVVTSDGHRLYVGEAYRGVRFAAIKHNQLTFVGERKIQMNW
ncbi:MAG: FHA domain-containing protein [Burkholderiaceae bacterium]